MRAWAPAKLNLELRILAREVSGYHQLESLFLGISLADELTVRRREAPGIELEVVGDAGGALGEDNLVYRAASSFLDAFGLGNEGISVGLSKRVPVAAGLGGGSSDAAAALRSLDRLFPGRARREELLALASELGSDIPFFMGTKPCAWAWSRGGRFLALDPPPARPALLAVPERGVSTREAYARLANRPTPRAAQPGAFELAGWRDWSALAGSRVNDFEPVLYLERPDLAQLGESMAATRPILCGMTGSGAAHFGIYADLDHRARAQASLEEVPGIRLLEAVTLEAWP